VQSLLHVLFLVFAHICANKRINGMYTVLRQTIRKRLQSKFNEVKAELRRRMHAPIPEQGKWLQAVIQVHVPATNVELFSVMVECGDRRTRTISAISLSPVI
jgi:hypothetical protein